MEKIKNDKVIPYTIKKQIDIETKIITFLKNKKIKKG
jgi:hypothetical protein